MDRHGIGGNEPPLEERLALDHADLLKRATEAAELVPETIRAIANDEEAEAYTETAADILKVLDEADGAFEPEKKPWRDGGKVVDDFFAFRKTLKAAADRAKAALNVFQTAKLAAKRKADEAAAALALKEAALFDEPAPIIAPTVVKEAARVVAFSGAKASGSIKWDYRVTDFEKIPHQYLRVNDDAVKAAVAGLKARGLDIKDAILPGFEIFEAVKTSIRR